MSFIRSILRILGIGNDSNNIGDFNNLTTDTSERLSSVTPPQFRVSPIVRYFCCIYSTISTAQEVPATLMRSNTHTLANLGNNDRER